MAKRLGISEGVIRGLSDNFVHLVAERFKERGVDVNTVFAAWSKTYLLRTLLYSEITGLLMNLFAHELPAKFKAKGEDFPRQGAETPSQRWLSGWG